MKTITAVAPGLDLPVHVHAKDQPEYIQLPCHRAHDGRVTIRWKLSWPERFAVFFGGSIWHSVLTFNSPLQPILLETACPISGTQEQLQL